ncbi:MAG: hypothetical protein ACFFEK_05480 [Candidatus Thorarchaeota archaeon]
MENDEEDVDWSVYEEQARDNEVHLDTVDYVALFIAALQTIFLPLVILIIFLFGLVFVLTILL